MKWRARQRPLLKLVVSVKASDRAYATLLDEIQSGELAPGAVLAEVEQSTRLGVSRTPFREALAKLTAEGLAVQVSPRITAVAPIDAGEIRKLFEVRRALEEAACRLAATNVRIGLASSLAFTELVMRLERAGADLSSPTTREAYYRVVSELDGAIDNALDNEYLISALRTIRTHLVRVRRMAADHPDRLMLSVSEHVTIARAIADGDAELAAHATHVHLKSSLTSILSYLS